jgi:hypothetical protein
MTLTPPIVRTSCGQLKGTVDHDVLVFRGIPYALIMRASAEAHGAQVAAPVRRAMAESPGAERGWDTRGTKLRQPARLSNPHPYQMLT